MKCKSSHSESEVRVKECICRSDHKIAMPLFKGGHLRLCLTCVNIYDMDTGYNDHLPEQNCLCEHGLSTNLAN